MDDDIILTFTTTTANYGNYVNYITIPNGFSFVVQDYWNNPRERFTEEERKIDI